MKSRLLTLVVILIVAAGAGYYVWQKYFTKVTPTYITTVVKTGTVSETVLATGIIKPSKLVAVGAQVSGRITAVHVALGDEVKAGDLIAEIDSVNEQNALKTAGASLANVNAQLLEKQADLKKAELVLARQQMIFAQNAGSRADLESAEASVATVKAQIEATNAQIDSAEVAVETAKANLGYTRITAPMDGTVLAIVNQEGRTVNANQSAPTIVILGNLERMTVRSEISEADIVKVKPGAKIYFNILGEPDRQYEEKLESIEPAPESITSDSAVTSSSTSTSSSASASSAIYYIGVFSIDNKERKFRTYMSAEVRIVLGEAKDVLTVPSSALAKDAKTGGYTVQVVGADGQATSKAVEVGLNNKTTAEIRSGLETGERIVVGQSSGNAKSGSSRGSGGPMGF